jgi:hypothetical protein
LIGPWVDAGRLASSRTVDQEWSIGGF